MKKKKNTWRVTEFLKRLGFKKYIHERIKIKGEDTLSPDLKKLESN